MPELTLYVMEKALRDPCLEIVETRGELIQIMIEETRKRARRIKERQEQLDSEGPDNTMGQSDRPES